MLGIKQTQKNNRNSSAVVASMHSRLRICGQLNKERPQAAVLVICATEHLLLSRGASLEDLQLLAPSSTLYKHTISVLMRLKLSIFVSSCQQTQKLYFC